jgi:hypothetical protein
MYHATTVLLPDGRVLSAGQDDGDSAFFGQIYEPAYLFRGPRPQIDATPLRISYAQQSSVATPQADQISTVALIAPSAVTHSVNFSQRYVGLDFTSLDSGTLQIMGPADGNHAPPGYYMLFIPTATASSTLSICCSSSPPGVLAPAARKISTVTASSTSWTCCC